MTKSCLSENLNSWQTLDIQIYPNSKTELNLSYKYPHYPIKIKTVNFNKHWREIEKG